MDVPVPVHLSKAYSLPGQICAVEGCSFPCACSNHGGWRRIECCSSHGQRNASPCFVDWYSTLLEKTTHGASPDGSKVDGKSAPSWGAFSQEGVRIPVLVHVRDSSPRSTPTPGRGSLFPISPRSRHGDPFLSRSSHEGVSFPRNPFDGESYPPLSPLPSPGGLLPSPISKGKRTPLSLPALRKGSFFPSDLAFPSPRRRPCVAHATRRDERHGMAHLAQRSGRAGAPHAHPANVRAQEEGKHAWDEKKAEETDAGRRGGAQHECGWKDERGSNEARLSFARVAQARNARRNRRTDGSRGSKEDEWVDATLQCSVHVHVALKKKQERDRRNERKKTKTKQNVMARPNPLDDGTVAWKGQQRRWKMRENERSDRRERGKSRCQKLT